MARIKSYVKDKNIGNDDLLVGSSYEGEGQSGPIYKTRNYRLEDLAKYMNLVFSVEEVNYNLVTITETLDEQNIRLGNHDNLFIDNSNFLLNLTSEFGEFDEFGNLISLSSAFANLLITTTTSARFAESQYVLNLGASVGLFDPNGNLTQLSTAFADQVITATASDRFAQTTFVTNLASSFGTYDENGNLVNFNNATFLDAITTYVDADLALSTQLTSLTASVNTNAAAITTETTARVTQDEALAQQITSLTATVSNNTAAITTESTVRATQDSALAQQITTLSAEVDQNAAAIVTESTARATQDSALASQITTLTATVSGNTAAITNEATARANADGALSSQISTVSATAAGNTASITTNATAIVDVNGRIDATYSIQVDANGHVAGLKLGANNLASEFIATADEFGVNMPNGTRVLTVDANGLVVNGSGTFSGNLSAAGGTFTTLTAANLKLSQNQILFDNSGTLGSSANLKFNNTSGNVFASIKATTSSYGDSIRIGGETESLDTIWLEADSFYITPSSGVFTALTGYIGNLIDEKFREGSLYFRDRFHVDVGTSTFLPNDDRITITPTTLTNPSLQINASGAISITAGNNGTSGADLINLNGRLDSLETYNNTSPSGSNMYVSNTGLIYRSSSSIKYKKDVVDYDKGINDIVQLRPVYYKSKNAYDNDDVHAGLIAEELQEAGFTEFVQRSVDGDPEGISYGHMVALLINGMKELKSEIESLKAQLNG